MANSKFGRHATRIQPAPKVCISKKAEQGPPERQVGKTAAIAFSHPPIPAFNLPARNIMLYAFSDTSNTAWQGQATTPEGHTIRASIIGGLPTPTVHVEDPFSAPGVGFYTWSGQLFDVIQFQPYNSPNTLLGPPLLGTPASATVMIS